MEKMNLTKLLLLTIGLALACTTSRAQADISCTPLTDLATYYVETENQAPIDSKEHYLWCRLTIVEGREQTVYDSVQIRGRGNSTWRMSPKKPYRLKFHYKLALLGNDHASARNWTLLANHGDKTLIRNALTEALGQFMGMPFCPAARFVDLVVNGQYQGCYQVSDQIQAGPRRVPVEKASGWIVETASKWNLEHHHVTTDHGMMYNVMNPGGKHLSPEKMEEIRLWLQRMESTVLSDHFTDSLCGYRSMIDGESLVNWYVASEITGNLDAMLSIYMYKENDDNHIHFGPLWDMDFAYDRSGERSMEQAMEAFTPFDDRPWQQLMKRLWSDPWFAQACHNRLESLVSAGLESYLDARIDSLVALTARSRQQNFMRWSISQPVYSWEKPVYHDRYEDYIADLKHFLAVHIPYLRKQFRTLAAAAVQP